MALTRRLSLYLAAPLFSEAERLFNVGVRDALLPYADVFLPQEDGALLVDLISEGMPVELAKQRIFRTDLRAIQKAHGLLILLDGRAVDEGAAFELGVAFALNKECWGLKTDIRQLLPSGDNPMIESAITMMFRSVRDLVEHVREERQPGILTQAPQSTARKGR